MDRRALLAYATVPTVIGLAGCIGDDDDDDSSNAGNDDGEPVLELQNLQPDDHPERASVTVEILEDQLTEDTFPTVEITVENTGDEPIDMDWQDPPFTPPWTAEDIVPDQLAIYPTEFITENLIDEPGSARIERVETYGDLQQDSLDSGDSMAEEYGIVFVDGKLADWPDPGEYHAGAGLNVDDPRGLDFDLVQVEGDPLPHEPTAEGGLVLEDVHLDEQPEPLTMTVEVIEDRLSEDSAPVVEVAMENTGDAAHEIQGSSTQQPPWPGLETDPDHFVFIPTWYVHQAVLNEPGCPRVDNIGGTPDIQTHTIEPEEVLTEEYAIVGINGRYEGDCPEAGTYRSEAHLGLEDEWGFDLEFDDALGMPLYS